MFRYEFFTWHVVYMLPIATTSFLEVSEVGRCISTAIHRPAANRVMQRGLVRVNKPEQNSAV